MKNFNIYSNKSINLISITITIIIFISINLFSFNPKNKKTNQPKKEIIEDAISKNEKLQELKENKKKKEKELEWYIEIPSINLKAPIEETTDTKVLNLYVGHFEETALTEGNIGLAGHNRGYKNNYFENLKKLKKGEEIKYQYKEFSKTYIIDVIENIKETNWKYLEKTESNKITLITCIENKPEYRLCIQATEKKNNYKLKE